MLPSIKQAKQDRKESLAGELEFCYLHGMGAVRIGKKTKYKDLVFRSKLEAKWAVFFDALSIPWKYEPEWFRLPDGRRYLPDFQIHVPFNEGPTEFFYVEVKSLSDFSTKINLLPERCLVI